MELETKKKVGKVVAVAAAGIALAVMVGKIVPLNLIDAVCDSSSYSSNQLFAEECCGPYVSCQCSEYKGAS